MIIIDMSHLFFRNFWMMKKDIIEYKPDEDGVSVPTGEINEGYMIHLIYNSVLNLTNKFKASKSNEVILALDSKPSWRHDFYIKNTTEFPEYKNQTYKGDRAKDKSIPWGKLMDTFYGCIRDLDNYSDFKSIQVDLAEADDIIAVLARNAPADEDVFICSGDKDFYQLQTNNIHIYDPIKKIIVPPMNITRHNQLHFMLAGDDNIKQIKKGVGIKTAERILNEGLDLYLQTNPEAKARYEFNQKMIDFNFIPKKVEKSILSSYNNYNGGTFNSGELMKLFIKYQLKKMVIKMNQFKLNDNSVKFNVPKNKNVNKVVETSIEDFFS